MLMINDTIKASGPAFATNFSELEPSEQTGHQDM